MRRVVSDTGPLISLEKLVGGYAFIRVLYNQILIPPSVLEELAEGGPSSYLAHFGIEDLLCVTEVPTPRPSIAGIERLDIGEQDAIHLAQALGLPLLIEEELGRRIARTAGLSISGIAGQIGRAASNGQVTVEAARVYMRQLYNARRINQGVYAAIVDQLEA